MDTLRPAALVSVLTIVATVAAAAQGHFVAALIAYIAGCFFCGILLFGYVTLRDGSNRREILGLPPKTR